MVDDVTEVIVPYVTETHSKLNLASDHPALVLFGVFKGHLVDKVR